MLQMVTSYDKNLLDIAKYETTEGTSTEEQSAAVSMKLKLVENQGSPNLREFCERNQIESVDMLEEDLIENSNVEKSVFDILGQNSESLCNKPDVTIEEISSETEYVPDTSSSTDIEEYENEDTSIGANLATISKQYDEATVGK